MNKKGMTTVELLVTFTILMVIVFGMLGIVIAVREDNLKKQFNKEIKLYNNIIINKIEEDLILLKYKNLSNCENTSENIICKKINFKDSSKELQIDLIKKQIIYDKIIYDIPSSDKFTLDDVYIKESEDLFLIINIAILKDNVNYGIKIVHPIDL